jgi:hypothetical protein
MRPPSLESGVFISPIDVMTIGGTARPTTRNALVHIQLEETHPTTLNHANQVVSNRFVHSLRRLHPMKPLLLVVLPSLFNP